MKRPIAIVALAVAAVFAVSTAVLAADVGPGRTTHRAALATRYRTGAGAHAHTGARRLTRAAATGVGFGTPTIVDTVHTYGEPDVKIAYDGSVYDSGPWGTGTQRSIWNQSTDGGRTFHTLHDTPIQSPEQSDSQHTGPGGGDTEISINRQNQVYYSDLAALTQLKVALWDKKTHTMRTDVLHDPRQTANGIDRQWFALWDPPDQQAVRAATGYTGPLPVNYLSFAQALAGTGCSSGSCEAFQYSTDGTTYSSTTVAYDIGSDGPLAIDQDTGTVFEAISLSDHDVGVAIVTRDPANKDDPSLVNAQRIKIADLANDGDVGALFPVIAEDQARNLYVAWVSSNQDTTAKATPGIWQIYYSYATAASGWKDWSTPVQVSSPPANTNIMPWMTAGADGRIAIAWYGTDDATHNPSTEDVHQKWHVYLAYVTNAASASPTVKEIRVTRHPMHYGSICLAGTGCIAQNPPGNRNLADFFEVETDPRTGAIVITYDDTSNNLKQHDPSGSQPPPEQVAHTGAPQVTLIRQNRGIGLFGTPVRGPKAIRPSIPDKRGDASFDPVYNTTNIPQLDIRGLRAKLLKKQLLIKLRTKDLGNLQPGFDATGATALDWVTRWIGPATTKAPGTEGLTNPIYYAAVEVRNGGDAPTFFTGLAKSIELCSVSGCFPHILEYPEPPYGGTSITGKLVKVKGPKPDYWLIRVPLKLIGNPRKGQLLEELGAYVFARNKPANVPTTNSEGEGGITPVMVDGVCCMDFKLHRHKHRRKR